MSTTHPIKVAIVDDNKSTVASMAEFINYSDKTTMVLRAYSGAKLLEELKNCSEEKFPDVVITDVDMPGMDGIEVVRHGKALYPDLKFLMLTVYDDEDTLFDAIKAGASGYLMKDERIPIIIDHIEQLVFNGSVPMSPRIARKTLQLLARSDRNKSDNLPDQPFNLSKREQEVLQLLVEGKNYKSIASELVISPNTVRKHISNIYRKLHISSKAQAIRYYAQYNNPKN
jgi:DNA-binding NarL/FixJ family response regulator